MAGQYGQPIRRTPQIMPVAAAPTPVAQPNVNTQGFAGETYDEKMARLAAEVRSGRRTFDQIRASADLQAGRQAGTYNTAGEAEAWKGRELERLQAIYQNRGLAGQNTPGARPTVAPISIDEYGRQLTQESQNRFLSANGQDINDILGQISRRQIDPNTGMERVQGGTANLDPINMRAGMAASVEIDPQRMAYDALMDERRRESDQYQEQTQKLGAGTEARQRQMYEALSAFLTGQQPGIDERYGTARAENNRGFDTSQTAIGNNYDRAQRDIVSEAARLGLDQAAPTASNAMEADQQFLNGLLESQQQGVNGTLRNLQQVDTNSLQQLLRSSNVEGTNVRAATVGDFARRQSDELLDKFKDIRGYNTESQMLEATRRGKVYEGVQSLKDAQAAALAAAEDAAFQRSLAEQELGIKAQDSQTKMFGAQTDRIAVNVAAQKTYAQLQEILNKNVPGTMEYETAAAAIRQKDADAAATLTNAATGVQNANTAAAKANNPAGGTGSSGSGGSTSFGRGVGGVTAYLAALGSDVSDHRKAEITAGVTSIMNQAGEDYPKAMALTEDYIRRADRGTWPAGAATAFRRATGIAYGKST